MYDGEEPGRIERKKWKSSQIKTEHSRLVEDRMEAREVCRGRGMELKLEDGMQVEKNRRGNKTRWSQSRGRYGGEG